MTRIFSLLALFALFIAGNLLAQEKVTDINYAHLYDPNEEIFLNYRLIQHPLNGKLLVLGIELNNRSTSMADYTVSFHKADSYSEALNMEITPIDSVDLGSNDRTHYVGYKFSTYPQLLIAKVKSALSGLSFYQDIRTSDVHEFILEDNLGRPVIQSFINEGRYDMLSSAPLQVTYYSHEFPPARPPMATDPGSVPRTMEVTNTFRLDTAYDHIYNEQGLYYVSDPRDETSGASFRVEGPYYPEYVSIPDLVEPLVYITTKKERQKLLSAKDDKKQFDQFWVEMTGDKEKARWIIKNYYQKVSEANKFFTTYKEGWKTDRGMVYIIFGTPDQVIRDQDSEIWTYLPGKRLPGMTFKFVTLQSRYTDRQYSLLRDKELGNGYIAAARYWREARPLEER